MTTLFEKYAPEIKELAAALEDEVRYAKGAWRLVHADRPLWESDCRGALTREGAREAAETLRSEIEQARPYREASKMQRAEEALDALGRFPFDCDLTATSHTSAMDTGEIHRVKPGEFTGWVAIGRERVDVAGGSHAECLERLAHACRGRWNASQLVLGWSGQSADA